MPRYRIQLQGVNGQAMVDADSEPDVVNNNYVNTHHDVPKRGDKVLRFKKGDQVAAEFSLDAVQGWWQDE